MTVMISPDAAVALLRRCTSFGLNCEFGAAQRAMRVESLGIYRYAASECAGIAAAIETDFVDIDRPDLLDLFVDGNPPEYMLRHIGYRFFYHTNIFTADAPPGRIAQEGRRLRFLAHKLRRELTDPRRIFVIKQGRVPIPQSHVEGLAAAMAAKGSATLLWVVEQTAAYAGGTAIRLAPNLLLGHIDRFAPLSRAHLPDVAAWLGVCQAAAHLHDGGGNFADHRGVLQPDAARSLS
jgi:hypothetical protein